MWYNFIVLGKVRVVKNELTKKKKRALLSFSLCFFVFTQKHHTVVLCLHQSSRADEKAPEVFIFDFLTDSMYRTRRRVYGQSRLFLEAKANSVSLR